jgi:hypothetical protein
MTATHCGTMNSARRCSGVRLVVRHRRRAARARAGGSHGSTDELRAPVPGVATTRPSRSSTRPTSAPTRSCSAGGHTSSSPATGAQRSGLAPRRELLPSKARLGNECLPNRCGCPSVRAVNRWNLLHVQLLGDLLQRHPPTEHRVDLHPPCVVTLVADPMGEPDVVGGEVTSVHLESRIVNRPSASNRHPAISARSTDDPGSSSTGASRNARR